MNEDINKLILSIRNTMKDYTEGNISFQNAKKIYQTLSDTCLQLEEKYKRDEGSNIFKGLSYYHNIENYSLLSGVYFIDSNDIMPLFFYGENGLSSKTMKAIIENNDSIKNYGFMTLPVDKHRLQHNVYVYPLFIEKNSRIMFVSVSSSTFFSSEKFTYTGELIKDLFFIVKDESHRYEIDFFDQTVRQINTYINENIDDEYYIQGTLFVFNLIEKMFNHMGIFNLFEIQNEIMNILKSKSKSNSQCFSLSTRDYIIFDKIPRYSKGNDKKKKIDFFYKGINIPYKVLYYKLYSKDSIYNFWDSIFNFSVKS